MTYSETHRIGTFDSGGRFTPLLDVNDGVNIRVREFKVVPSEKQPVYPGATRRYGGSRKAGETHGNGSLSVSWILRDSTADEVLGQWDALAELLESARTDLFYEWRPGEATRSTYFELRGGLAPDFDYVWWQFNREILQLSAGFVVAPLAFGDPMDVFDGFSSDTIADYTFDAAEATDVAVVGGVLTVIDAPFDPLTLSPAVWIDASQETAYADAASVSSATDWSGNARHAVQGTGSAQPTFQTNELNGKPVYRFAGTDDRLVIPAFSHGDSYTVFIVVKSTVTSGTQEIVSSANVNFKFLNDGGNTFQLGQSGVSGFHAVVAAANSFYVLTARRDAASSVQVYVNGTGGSVLVPSGAFTPTSATFAIGSSFNGFNFLTGDVAEVLIFTTHLSDANRDAVKTYLGTKYAITVV